MIIYTCTKNFEKTIKFESGEKMCIVAINTRKILNERGLKHKVIAKRAGYTETQFSNILCGRKNIETDDVLRISKALDVLPNELYGITS